MVIWNYINNLPPGYRFMAQKRVKNGDLVVYSISEALQKGWVWEKEEEYFWELVSDFYLNSGKTPLPPEPEMKLIWPQKP